MIDLGLVVARLLHYAATTTLFGASLFSAYAYAGDEPSALRRWRMRLLLSVAIVALLGGFLWFAFAVANMSGSLSDLTDAEVLSGVIRDTNFGVVWTARMVLAAILVLVTALAFVSTAISRWNFAISILGAMLLASLAATGHAQAEEGWRRFVHVASDGAHLLAAGAWLGGLVPLAHVLERKREASLGTVRIGAILRRFSGMGYAAVATLIGTGTINSWFLVGSVSNLLMTVYGRVLLAKLLLFAGMLALAAANRFWLTPIIGDIRTVAGAASSDQPLRRLRNHVLVEQLLGASVLAAVGLLGPLPPGIAQ